MKQTPVVQARGLSKHYGARAVLRDLDFVVDRGEIVAILGANGAGKTTLLSLLVGAEASSSGSIEGPAGQRVGWAPQDTGTYGRLTVRENLEFFARLLALPDARSRARDIADGLSLLPWWDTPARRLSGGTRQRLNIAVALLGNPELLVLDEPSTAIDLRHGDLLWTALRRRAGEGTAIAFATHSLSEAGHADRVVVLADGTVAYDGALTGIGGTEGLLKLWGPIETPQSESTRA